MTAAFVCSGFGIGWLPGGCSIITLPIMFLMLKYASQLNPYFLGEKLGTSLSLYFISALIAVLLIQLVEEKLHRRVVIDRIWGITAALFLVPISWKTVLVAFALYRFFDIVKPWPIYHLTNFDGGLGAILDDIFSGILTSLSLQVILIAYHSLMSYL